MNRAQMLTAIAVQNSNQGNALCEAAVHIEAGCCVKADSEIAAWLSHLGDQYKESAIALQVQAMACAREADL